MCGVVILIDTAQPALWGIDGKSSKDNAMTVSAFFWVLLKDPSNGPRGFVPVCFHPKYVRVDVINHPYKFDF